MPRPVEAARARGCGVHWEFTSTATNQPLLSSSSGLPLYLLLISVPHSLSVSLRRLPIKLCNTELAVLSDISFTALFRRAKPNPQDGLTRSQLLSDLEFDTLFASNHSDQTMVCDQEHVVLSAFYRSRTTRRGSGAI